MVSACVEDRGQKTEKTGNAEISVYGSRVEIQVCLGKK